MTRSDLLTRTFARGLLFALILSAHVIVGMRWGSDPIHIRTMSTSAEPMFAQLFEPDSATSPAPSVPQPPTDSIDIPPPDLPPDALSSADEPEIEAPQIDPQLALDIRQYAARADLAAGKTATVMMSIDVGADGAVISAQVVHSNGSASANEAALAYARATRWIPGMVDGQPRAMVASLTVILGEAA